VFGLIDQLETAELSGWAGQRLMTSIAEAVDEASLANLQATGVAQLRISRGSSTTRPKTPSGSASAGNWRKLKRSSDASSSRRWDDSCS